jgi:ubiquinone/menaquinone biosynthesis C-methylase UbiE
VDYDSFAPSYSATRALTGSTTSAWTDAMLGAVDGRPVRRVLDAGCGIGRFLPTLRQTFPEAQVVGMDASTGMLARAASDVPGAVLAHAALPDLPFGNGVFDVVLLSMVLHHCPDPVAALRDCSRVLAPDGVILVRAGSEESISSFEFLHFFPDALAIERSSMPAREELLGWFRSAGLTARHRVVEQRMAATYEEYHERISRGGFPSFSLVPPERLREAMPRFARHCEDQAAEGRQPPPELVDFVAAER